MIFQNRNAITFLSTERRKAICGSQFPPPRAPPPGRRKCELVHSGQNLLPSGRSALQLGQRTDHLPGLRAFYFSTVSQLRCGIGGTALECRPKR
jgi:hypothetical protein